MRKVKLADVLSKSVAKANEVYLDGIPAPNPGDDSVVRLYPDLADGSFYYLIRVEDILNTEQWEPDEVKQAGFLGGQRYRLTVPASAKLQSVTTETFEASSNRCNNVCRVTCSENGYTYTGRCDSGYRAECNVDCRARTGSTRCTRCP